MYYTSALHIHGRALLVAEPECGKRQASGVDYDGPHGEETDRIGCTAGTRAGRTGEDARDLAVGVVLSEDFQDGQEIEGVRFIDPFAKGFDLARGLS